MKRLTIIGNGGSGKTTLALRLGEATGLPVFHMDQIIYQPGWVRTPDEEVRRQIVEICEKPAWIFDGMGPLWSAEYRMRLADLVIFLDFPFEHCVEWAMVRQRENGASQQVDRPDGCLLEGQDERMIAALSRVEKEFLPQLREWVLEPEIAAKSIHLHDRGRLEQLYHEIFGRFVSREL